MLCLYVFIVYCVLQTQIFLLYYKQTGTLLSIELTSSPILIITHSFVFPKGTVSAAIAPLGTLVALPQDAEILAFPASLFSFR